MTDRQHSKEEVESSLSRNEKFDDSHRALVEIRKRMHGRLHEAAGDVPNVAMSFTAAADQVAKPLASGNNSTQNTLDTPNRTEASERNRAEVEDSLEEIATQALTLSQMNMEHRVDDFRDWIPIWANVRSHTLATKEGQTISTIKAEYEKLQALVSQSAIKLDLNQLSQMVDALKVPFGFTKWVATLAGTRTLHRAIFAPSAEKLRAEASKLKRQVRR